jgi:anti-sigma regulatory factor (Ser/Thr protein kinase)
MQARYLLDWATTTVSFFNTIALLWLGLTVLLNADRRTWGTWAAGGGCLLGGLFFVGHSAVVGRGIGTVSPEVEFWWRLSWLIVIGAPYMWYIVMAWYSGVLGAGRHRTWLAIISLLGIMALVLLAVANPLPTYGEILQRTPIAIFSLDGIPVVALIYPVYSVLCIVLSLSALRRPVASERFMGDLARQRARPWLVAASFVLLGVGLAIGLAIIWFLHEVQLRSPVFFITRMLPLVTGFDLLISGMVAVAIILMGRAIVAYEIFTGKALPRGGLVRYWRRSLILAAGYGVLIGGSLSIPLPIAPIYQLLLATALMTLFYALLSWRSYVERERSMDRLRPFVASQRLYERLLQSNAPPDVDVVAPLRALCDDVLGARVAYLSALGPLGPLLGPGLVYDNAGKWGIAPPADDRERAAGTTSPWPNGTPAAAHLPPLTELVAQFDSPQTMCVPLEHARYGSAVWAVPLWSERGLIGVLLLGEKRDGGLYTQEEIEIARATGERLIDTQASAELARRLMALQRRRLAESQVLDRRARRVLHDDVLPRLHAAMLMLGSAERSHAAPLDGRAPPVAPAAVEPAPPATHYAEAVALLGDIHRQIANLLHAMPAMTVPEVARLGLIGALRQTVANELGSDFDAVVWQIAPEAEQAAQTIPALAAEVIYYAAREALRNAARYGRAGDPARPLHLTISGLWRGGLVIVIEDDGAGLGAARASSEGSGQGLGLHSTMMAVIGGTLTAESVDGAYTRISLALPPAIWDGDLPATLG